VYYKAQPNAEEYTYSVEELRESLAIATQRPDLAIERYDDDVTTTNTDDCKTNGSCGNDTCGQQLPAAAATTATTEVSSCPSGTCAT
jgi:hypothetical protein